MLDCVTWDHPRAYAGLDRVMPAFERKTRCLLDLDLFETELPPDEIEASALGPSLSSYRYGGQPACQAVWVNDELNRASNGFYRDTLPAMQRAPGLPNLSPV